MARRFKFPNPGARSSDKPAVLCPAKRVLDLYNQDNDPKAARISNRVRTWFFENAQELGWAGIHFIPEAQSGCGAGCVLWIKQVRARGNLTAEMLVLDNSQDE